MTALCAQRTAADVKKASGSPAETKVAALHNGSLCDRWALAKHLAPLERGASQCAKSRNSERASGSHATMV
jgi:hypothetical protein